MIRCDICLQRFHLSCVHLLHGSIQIAGDWVYRFSCSVCTRGNESFERFAKNWVDVLEIVLYNLGLANPSQTYFSFDNEIVPKIEANWHLLCSDKKKKAHWQKQLLPALADGRIFKSGEINLKKPGFWALGTNQLMIKDNPIFKDKVLAPLSKKKKKKQITAQEKRIIIEDNLTAKNMKGYRMAKASVPCISGSWYFEMEVLNKEGSTRLGWSTFRGDKQANVGYDQFSYGYRSQQGDIFHRAKGQQYGEAYGQGDVVGFYINLPVQLPTSNGRTSSGTTTPPPTGQFQGIDQITIYEMVEKELETDELEVVPGSEIRFFKNGVSPGPAYTNIGRAMYYPAASMYMGAS
eukprot:gene7205-8369_t